MPYPDRLIGRLRRLAVNMPRPWKQAVLIVTDVPLLLLTAWLSFEIRLGGPSGALVRDQILLILGAPVISVPVFFRSGLYQAVLRYLPDRAVWMVARAMLAATLIWVVMGVAVSRTTDEHLPNSVPIIYFALGTIAVLASRMLAKSLYTFLLGGRPRLKRVIIYGAGPAAVHLAEALRADGLHKVVCFVDDDLLMQGRNVAGLPIHAPQSLGRLTARLAIEEIIIALPSLGAAARRQIASSVASHSVTVRTLPSISQLARGNYVVSQLQDIDIDDLLGRSSVPADPKLLAGMIKDRTILVTGAGGSIGSELVRLLARWQPRELVLLDVSEFALYEIERELRAQGAPIVPVLGSVTDLALLQRLFASHRIDAVFHAAAYKHVPLLETNACEAVRNNVLGTRYLVQTAEAAGVQDLVLVSTDKAVHPTSVMGATKRWAEYLVQEVGQRRNGEAGARGARYCVVRFGNVLGSKGSVVPLFREQIASGGPVTVTHKDMTRYFMSVHEAAELIAQAGALSRAGEVFILDMGAPLRILDLAQQMIALSGRTVRTAANPDGEIEIEIIGSRRGEKIHEELFYDPGNVAATAHPKIMAGHAVGPGRCDLITACEEIGAAAQRHDEAAVRQLLFAYVEAHAIPDNVEADRQDGVSPGSAAKQPALADTNDPILTS